MVNYNQFSPRTVSTENSRLWNPSKTLEIINPDRDCLTCVGQAPTQGRRCRLPIRADNRALIMRTLDDIAYLPPDSPAVMSRLRAIAGPALCVNYHQNQDETIVKQWQSKIQSLEPPKRKSAKSTQSSRRQESARHQEVEDLRNQLKEMMEAMAKLKEECDSPGRRSQERTEAEERIAKERQEAERIRRRREERQKEARRKESERLETERLAQEKRGKEEKERLAKEKREKEERQRREREDAAAANERIHQRAQKRREESKREKREKEQSERTEWDQLWAKYQERWTELKTPASGTRESNIRDAIPWPVKSGAYRDVKASNVKEFFQKAVSREEDMPKLMRKECLNWHPDKRPNWLQGVRLSDVDEMMVDMIYCVVSGLLAKSTGR